MSTPPEHAQALPPVAAAVAALAGPPRIKKILISGYRAFPPYKPKSLEIDLGDAGDNLLVHGENGSGKTSLFRALKDLFDTSTQRRDYATHQNIFEKATDDAIAIELTSGGVPDYRWEVGNHHPKVDEGDGYQQFARSGLLLDYRDLLQTNFVHRDGDPNLFALLVDVILAELPVPARPLRQFHREMRMAVPSGRQTKNPIRSANARAEALRRALADHLPELVRAANQLLGMLQPNTTLKLTPPPAITYNKRTRDFDGKTVTLSIELSGKTIPQPQYFLNEARLTAIALALYLAAARLTRSGRPGIMVLDDVLIGLDLTNRMPLLQMLESEFNDWQILLLTHDASWFDMASHWLDKIKWRFHRLHTGREPGTGRERPVHIIETEYLARAEAYLHAGTYPAAGVYLRSKFEALLRDFAEDKRLSVPFKRELRELNSEHLWPGVRDWSPRNGRTPLVSPGLARQIEFCRRFILNPLCHEAEGRPNEAEVRLALSALKQLEAAIQSVKTWQTDWDRKHAKSVALPKCWHMALCEWLFDLNPAPDIHSIGIAVRDAFVVGLDSYNRRHRAFITHTADSYATRGIQWDAARAAGLDGSHSAFVALIAANAAWLLTEAPQDSDWVAVTPDKPREVFDALRGETSGKTIRCTLEQW